MQLDGGRVGKIKKQDDCVIRPANPWTLAVQSFLQFLWDKGFDNIPKPYGLTEDGKEMVSYVDGDVYHDDLWRIFQSEEVLIDVAKLLRRFHNAGKEYMTNLTGDEPWMLQKRQPQEVMCHGDFAPYNITFVDGKVSGIIDFDTLHPGPALWDIAYAVYRWIPFVSPENPDYCYDLPKQIERLKLFADSYGMDNDSRKALLAMMIKRITALVDYMKEQESLGNEDVIQNIKDGHMDLYLQDIAYLQTNEDKIIEGIIS